MGVCKHVPAHNADHINTRCFASTLPQNGIASDCFSRSEVMLMMRTLRDMNMSKFVAEDVPLFLSLIDDLFPGLKAERSQFPEVTAALEKVRHGSACPPKSSSLLYACAPVHAAAAWLGDCGGTAEQYAEWLASPCPGHAPEAAA